MYLEIGINFEFFNGFKTLVPLRDLKRVSFCYDEKFMVIYAKAQCFMIFETKSINGIQPDCDRWMFFLIQKCFSFGCLAISLFFSWKAWTLMNRPCLVVDKFDTMFFATLIWARQPLCISWFCASLLLISVQYMSLFFQRWTSCHQSWAGLIV